VIAGRITDKVTGKAVNGEAIYTRRGGG
jgi:hypothetical protein